MTAGLNEERYYKSAKAFFVETKKYIDAYFYVNKKIASIVKNSIKAKKCLWSWSAKSRFISKKVCWYL